MGEAGLTRANVRLEPEAEKAERAEREPPCLPRPPNGDMKHHPGMAVLTKTNTVFWSQIHMIRGGRSDDDIAALADQVLAKTSLYRTPQPGRPGLLEASRAVTAEELRESELSLPSASEEGPASSHTLVKNRVPQRCAHCDTLSFFLTFSCTVCGLSWHRSCLGQLRTACGETASGWSPEGKAAAPQDDKSRIFGVPLDQHLADSSRSLPVVVERCVEELDRRGRVKGLYRVCGAKSKIDGTCGAIEAGGGEGPYADTTPSVLASVLKLYLRQLPQPLLTEALYGPCLALAKEFPSERELGPAEAATALLPRLRALLRRLPDSNFRTLQYLILHLRRMTWFEAETSMNAMNLGIVFGPTLMGREEAAAANAEESLQPLLQLPCQTRFVELLILYAYEIFDVAESGEIAAFCARTGLSADSIPVTASLKKPASEALRRGSSLSSLSVATTPDPHSPHSTSDDYVEDCGASGLGPNKIPIRGGQASASLSLPYPRATASQRSPVTSEDSGTKTGSESAAGSPPAPVRQKSATPDLLKGRPRAPPVGFASPASSQDNDATLQDHSTSDEDPPSFTAATTPEEEGDAGAVSGDTAASTPSRRKPRFERGARPVRRNSRPRNYTTSIFVSPSKFEGGGSERRRSSEDLPRVAARVEASLPAPLPASARSDAPAHSVTAQGDSVHILLSASPDELSYV